MIYLDYAANTPVKEEVLLQFCKINREYIANPNSTHALGREAKKRMEQCSKNIAEIIGVKPEEVIYTSGASEANNLAIKGIARTYRNDGKHIISTALEHSSVSGALTFLQTQGYEIDLLDIKEDGTVDLEHLEELMREDTILVTIGLVDSEIGVEQPIREIASIVRKYPACHLHIDATQAVGKIPVDFSLVDCATFAPHKFFGLNGFGILVRKEGIVLEPLIHGGASTTIYRSGTPVLGMAVATEVAIKCAYSSLEEQYSDVKQKKEWLLQKLSNYKEVRINSTEKSIPHILNLSVKGIKAGIVQQSLEKRGVYLSTKSACSVPNTPSRAVYAVTKDKKNALSSFRISLSQQTTYEELQEFTVIFGECYKQWF